MDIINVCDAFSSYKIYITSGCKDLKSVLGATGFEKNNKIFIITNHMIYSIYKEKINELFSGFNFKVHVISSGEKNKNIDTVNNIYKFLLKNGSDRSSTLVAFGGGIVGDLTGFVAATYMRGMKYISIPTTVISMVDSSVGGKVGYNFQNIKNAIGTFYAPHLVFIDMDFLKTLPEEEFINGMAEVVKYGIIKEKSLLNYLKENLKEILSLEDEKLLYIIKESLKIKSEVVSRDFRDSNYRNILNFGHTIGHGIEIASDHTLSHGYAVALGMLAELRLSQYKLGLDEEVYIEVYNLLRNIGFPTQYKVDNINLFMYAIKHDKKIENNEITMPLIEKIGLTVTKVVVEENLIINAIEESIGRR